MADIYRAYRLLNKMLDLGLSDNQLLEVERTMKAAWVSERGMKVGQDQINDWEFFADLRPRTKGSAPPRDFEVPTRPS
jgi:hypothetical protein